MRLSVCIPTYNGEKYIKAQLQSILDQLGPEDEIIISDDSSSDGTLGVIASLGDARIKVFPTQRFRSPIYNLENALRHSQGKYIFLSDQDDVWAPEKVATILPLFDQYDVIVSDCDIVDQNLRVIHPSFFALYGSGTGLVKNLLKNSYLGCCMAFKRELLAHALPFPARLPMHDIWLGFVAELFMKTYFLPRQLVHYRRHDNNESPTSESSPYSLLKRVSFRWNTVKHLPRLFYQNKIKITTNG